MNMMTNAKRIFAITLPVLMLVLVTGCGPNYEKMYKALDVEHKNLVGLYENCQSENGQLKTGLSQSQATIEDLQNQITKQHKTPAQATGFEGMDVKLDGAEGTITVTLQNSILFSSGSATLLKDSEATLNKIQSVVKEKYAGKKVDIVGHTDSDPIQKSKWKDNWELSTERALSVVRYMEGHGMEKSLLRACGCGDGRPVTSNQNAAGKAKNRRVEVVVHVK
jgi:chemotaxis protein MotB